MKTSFVFALLFVTVVLVSMIDHSQAERTMKIVRKVIPAPEQARDNSAVGDNQVVDTKKDFKCRLTCRKKRFVLV
nr:venom protein [Lampona murina]